MVDYIFDSIKESEQMILTDPSLSVVEKLHRILGVLPEGYQNIDLRKLYSLRDKYPKIYQKVELRLSTGWEPTIQLIEMGMAEGSIRPVPICLVKMMLEASIEQCMYTDPEYRRRGIAKELLSRVIDDAREYGCGTIQITASDMGVKLYTDFGFVHNGNFMQYKL